MSRFTFQLNAKPEQLKKAIQGIEKPRRSIPDLRLPYEDFAKELPNIPQSKFTKWKIKKSAQELIPYLLIDIEKQNAIKKPLFALIKTKFSVLHPKTKRRILMFGLMHPEIRKIGYRFYSTSPPEPDAPRWIRSYWKQILRPESPVQSIVSLLSFENIAIVDMISWLEINPCAEIIDAVFLSYSDTQNLDLLTQSAYQDVYRFVDSSAPPKVRKKVLSWVLNTYAEDWEKRAEIPKPFSLLLNKAQEQWGNSHRNFWNACSPQVQRLLSLLEE